MGLPNTTSKYKGACKKCKVEYAAGTIIYKINESYWCSNAECPGSPGEKQASPKVETSIDLEAKLDQIWQVAYAKATKIVDATKNSHTPSENERQKLIMAQTFCKVLGYGS